MKYMYLRLIDLNMVMFHVIEMYLTGCDVTGCVLFPKTQFETCVKEAYDCRPYRPNTQTDWDYWYHMSSKHAA